MAIAEPAAVVPHYADDWLTVYGGDCRDVLATMPAESIDCIVTSPPYWGLRDYGYAGQLGLEATPDEYVANLVAVFTDIRRVLKPSGTCWLNLGDSYASHDPGGRRDGEFLNPNGVQNDKGHKSGPAPRNRAGNYRPSGLKPKDMVGIPWRVAFALQADGWYLRSEVIWAKPNPMPESVTDRPTKSHETIFLLTKSARYYYDAAAIAEETISHPAGNGFDRPERISGGLGMGNPEPWVPKPSRRDEWGRDGNPVSEHVIPGQSAAQHRPRESKKRGEFNGKTEAMPGRNAFRAITATRNVRDVWTMATRPYPGAHFAVFPSELPERCIKAGSPEGGVVLDPFAGSGTVGLVANRLSRRAVLIDLNPDYLRQQMARNAQTPLGLTLSPHIERPEGGS